MPRRAGQFKQSNKAHKRHGHASKRQLKERAGGRVEHRRDVKARSATSQESQRQRRANQAKQKREAKREEQMLRRRIGGSGGPPKTVAFLSLSPRANCEALGLEVVNAAAASTLGTGNAQSVTCLFEEPRMRVTLIRPERNLDGAIEAARVADVLVLALDMSAGEDGAEDELTDVMITTLKAQGLPAVLGVTQGLDGLSTKEQARARSYGKRFFQTEFPQHRTWDSGNMQQVGGRYTAAGARAHTRAGCPACRPRVLLSFSLSISRALLRGDGMGGPLVSSVGPQQCGPAPRGGACCPRPRGPGTSRASSCRDGSGQTTAG